MCDHALAYADRGIPVLPLHEPTGWFPEPNMAGFVPWKAHGRSNCTCGAVPCAWPGKHARGGVTAATASTDAEEISRWWGEWPAANIGLVCGVVMNVLDIDDEPSQRFLAERWTGPDDQPQVATPAGCHLYFAVDGSVTVAAIHGGLDWRAAGGWVLAPPSVGVRARDKTGRLNPARVVADRRYGSPPAFDLGLDTYRWLVPLSESLPPPPEWLARLAASRAGRVGPQLHHRRLGVF